MKQVKFKQIAELLQGRSVSSEEVVDRDGRQQLVVVLDDGISFHCDMPWTGPYSETTPDPNNEPLTWYLH